MKGHLIEDGRANCPKGGQHNLVDLEPGQKKCSKCHMIFNTPSQGRPVPGAFLRGEQKTSS